MTAEHKLSFQITYYSGKTFLAGNLVGGKQGKNTGTILWQKDVYSERNKQSGRIKKQIYQEVDFSAACSNLIHTWK